jgi:hypothetical protein
MMQPNASVAEVQAGEYMRGCPMLLQCLECQASSDACPTILPCVWSFRARSIERKWRFPSEPSKNGPENSERVAGARWASRRRAWRRSCHPRGGAAILHCHSTLSFYTVILHCHSTLPLAVIGCHSLGICTVSLLPRLSFSGEMTAPPARPDPAPRHPVRRRGRRARRPRGPGGAAAGGAGRESERGS